MKFSIVFLLLIINLGSIFELKSQEPNNIMGRDYWIAIPPNEMINFQKTLLALYCSSPKKGVIKLYSNNGLNKSKAILAGSQITFSDHDGDISWAYEIRESDKVLNKAIRVYGDVPFSLNVMNDKHFSGDGYTAIPVNALGNKYLHCAYYDNDEGSSFTNFKSGFVVVAHQNETKINISLRGLGKGFAKTECGRDIGDNFSKTLDRGQVYMIRGDGTTRGTFDLSGSEVSSNKTFSLLSFHMRTSIPRALSSSRDCLVEMMRPTSYYGENYIGVEYNRKHSRSGDMFRIVAIENNTNFSVTWYDNLNKMEKISNWEGTLHKAGDFATFKESLGDKSIFGCSVFRSYSSSESKKKPILVMQYAYSAMWDSNNIFDPFMALLTPTKEYTSYAQAQSASNVPYQFNSEITLIAKQDTNDINMKTLKSLYINEEQITEMKSEILSARIPGTEYHYVRIPCENSYNEIKGNEESRFGGYVFGYSQSCIYGWPISNFTEEPEDTIAPAILCKRKEYEYNLDIFEIEDVDFYQSGISNIEIKESENIEFSFQGKIDPSVQDIELKANLEDEYSPASFELLVNDKAGNYSSYSSKINMDTLQISADTIDLGYFLPGMKIDTSFVISNPVDSNQSRLLEIISSNKSLKFDYSGVERIEIDDEIKIDLSITTSKEEEKLEKIKIHTSYIEYYVYVKWNTAKPPLASERIIDFGKVDINTSKDTLVSLRNIIDHDLEINELYISNGNYFSILDGSAPPVYTINANNSKNLSLKFSPLKKDEYKDTLHIKYSGGQTYIVLLGEGNDPSSIEELDNSPFTISPNPSNGEYITFNMETESKSIKYSIIDINGKELIEEKIINTGSNINERINISKLPSATYYLKIDDGKEVYSKVFVVNR